MKMHIVGIEASQGTSKAGKPYAIGQIHTLAALAPGLGDSTAKGQVGTTYRADPELVRKIAHLPFPVLCEVQTQAQVRFGNREEIIVDLRPLEAAKG